ncbi:substrate-binding domain-containing protein [Bacillus sp. V3B]|uniref:substrate-binding domain-containing protein n=1 Tax=Bacillus sp. V3B TaxID=2804915 RepID=UPI00210B0147|nr:substrate-binding domain-containing protein [Bacillus sp. V3B]MCQ6275632.1 substrate-binding domain-containing protein [Bacillus sp. V3B]
MKCNHYLLTSIFTISLLLLGACSNPDNTNETGETEEPQDLILATTTSTQDSGLLDEIIIPMFEEQNENLNVKTIAVGTGQALEMGKKGEADVLLVHAPTSEEEIVASGDATNRQRVMYNDFIIVGPANDPAGIKGLPITKAFEEIMSEEAVFVSRGDDSGTHKKELGIWKSAELTPADNASYMESGQGMGNTLQIANEKDGYTLTDRATFLAQEKNLTNLQIVVEGSEELKNIYHVMQVNPEKHDKVNSEAGEIFVDFMINENTQKAIGEFGKDKYGQALFFPDAE